MLKAYKYRLLPTDEQKLKLSNWMGACRFVFNLALETKVAAWKAGKRLSAFDLMKQLTELKKTECKWLSEFNAQSLESAITNLDKAYNKFFGGGGFPNFKHRGGRESIQFRMGSKINDTNVYLPKFGLIEFIKHRPIPEGEIRTVTVSKTPAGNYFVSILVKTNEEIPDKKDIIENTAVGIDVGLKTFASLSNGETFDNPKYLQQQLKRLKKEQRTLARRYRRGVKISEQSKGYHTQRLVVAKLHEHIANQRKDFLHKVSAEVIKNNDTICLEDLNISGMIKNGNLAKSITDVGWNEFARLLEYKAEWNGKNVVYIGRFEPSSKMCSFCGTINAELKLSDRIWTCETCGEEHDRDHNAAVNIKQIALQITKI